jgi:hypothetical protein
LGAYTYVTVKPEIPLDSVRLKLNRMLNLAGGQHARSGLSGCMHHLHHLPCSCGS